VADLERIKTSLESSPYEPVRKVTVKLDGQRVILSGTVRSFYMKQVAQETARLNGNGFMVVNHIEVELE
jgi:osmotically-inducible protein OsmY